MWDLEAAAALPGDISILWTHLGIKTWVKKREQECLGREIPTWLFILPHVNYFCFHDMKEYWILLKTNQWSQPALVHVASMHFSHVFLTFSASCTVWAWHPTGISRSLLRFHSLNVEEYRPLEVSELTALHHLNKNCFQGSLMVP